MAPVPQHLQNIRKDVKPEDVKPESNLPDADSARAEILYCLERLQIAYRRNESIPRRDYIRSMELVEYLTKGTEMSWAANDAASLKL